MRRDVVYILGKGSRWGDGEIRYSLRSVEKFFPHKNVIVVGERPAWLFGIRHVKKDDTHSNPLKNGIDKIEAAVYSKLVTDPFVLMNDDFFFLKPVEEIKPFHRGKLKATIAAHLSKAGYYYKALVHTLELLQDIGIDDPIDYEVHYPVLFEKEKVLNTLAVFPGGLLLRTLYGNLFKVGGEFRADHKFNSTEIMTALIKKLDPDLISTSDHVVLGTNFQKWVSERFPETSSYETDKGKGVRAWRREHDKGPRYGTHTSFRWKGQTYNPGDIVRDDIPKAIVKEYRLIDLNA